MSSFLKDVALDFEDYEPNTTDVVVKPRQELAGKLIRVDLKLSKILIQKLLKIAEAISAHAEIAQAIADAAENGLQGIELLADESKDSNSIADKEEASARVQVTIRQLWRDWSEEGQHERTNAYQPVIDALNVEFSKTHKQLHISSRGANIESNSYAAQNRFFECECRPPKLPEELGQSKESARQESPPFRVLVPGAGLCRLAFDLHDHGTNFEVEANEMSIHELFAVKWISQAANSQLQKVYPWALQSSNQETTFRQFEYYKVPIGPISPNVHRLKFAQYGSGLSLHAFNEEGSAIPGFKITTHDFHRYSQARYTKSFHAVATVFFIDTAPNVREYISIINHVLPIGGVWVNNGPLLWNCWENGPPARGEGDAEVDEAARARHGLSVKGDNQQFTGKVELCWDELMMYLEMMGFKVQEQNVSRTSGYIQDDKSMLYSTYRLGFFKARKVADLS